MEQVEKFRKSLQFVLKWEGGYVNDIYDAGKATKWGITSATLSRFFPGVDVKDLTPEQASSIYATGYWDSCGCDAISYPYCTVVFDSSVQHGASKALEWLRKSADVTNYLNFRKMYYQAIVNNRPEQRRYLSGWLNRLADLTKLVEIALDEQKQEQQRTDGRWGALG